MQELLSEQEIATMLHSTKRFVQDLRRAQVLHPAKFGKHWLYRKEEVEEYIEHMFSLNEKK
jgi:excisionase family DNA binding protein